MDKAISHAPYPAQAHTVALTGGWAVTDAPLLQMCCNICQISLREHEVLLVTSSVCPKESKTLKQTDWSQITVGELHCALSASRTKSTQCQLPSNSLHADRTAVAPASLNLNTSSIQQLQAHVDVNQQCTTLTQWLGRWCATRNIHQGTPARILPCNLGSCLWGNTVWNPHTIPGWFN